MSALLVTALIGLIAGALAKAIMPGRGPGGLILTMLGIAGAFVGTMLGRALGTYSADSSAGFVASVLGAVLLLFLYRKFHTA